MTGTWWDSERCQGKELGKEPTDQPAPAGALWERVWVGRGHPDRWWTEGARGCGAPWRQQNRAEYGAVLAEPQAAA